MEVNLVMFKADGSRRDFPVRKSKITVGRISDCDLRIPLSSVSRHHCELRVERGAVKLIDLNSSNGTLLNGTRIAKEVALHPGDRVQVGPVILTVVIDNVPSRLDPTDTLLDAHAEMERQARGGGADAKKKQPTPAAAQAKSSKPAKPSAGGRARDAGKGKGPPAKSAKPSLEELDSLLADIDKDLLADSGDSGALLELEPDDETDSPADVSAKPTSPKSRSTEAPKAVGTADGADSMAAFNDMLSGIEDKINSEPTSPGADVGEVELPVIHDSDASTIDVDTTDRRGQVAESLSADNMLASRGAGDSSDVAEVDAEVEDEAPAPAPKKSLAAKSHTNGAAADDIASALESLAADHGDSDLDFSWLNEDEEQQSDKK